MLKSFEQVKIYFDYYNWILEAFLSYKESKILLFIIITFMQATLPIIQGSNRQRQVWGKNVWFLLAFLASVLTFN